MNNTKSRWLAVVGLAVIAGLTNTQAEDKAKEHHTAQPNQQYQGQPLQGLARQGQERRVQPLQGLERQGQERQVQPLQGQALQGQERQVQPLQGLERQGRGRPKLETKTTADGGYVKTTASGSVRERADKSPDGYHIQQFTPTGRVRKEEIQKPDGTKHTRDYDLGHHREIRAEVVHADKSREITNVHYNRNGEVHSRETVNVNATGKTVSKTVVVNQNIVVNNTTIVNTTVVRNYNVGRYGFVYCPVYVVPSLVFVSWYDPYWYTPVGVPIYHPFTYSWGWNNDPWYCYHAYYWEPYPVYSAPSYWVTDWMVASYVADCYAVSVSVDQTREEVRLAREDAENAKLAAEKAKDAAGRAGAQAAQSAAEARAERAEARAAKAEAEDARRKALAGKPNPNATPIDKDTKEALKNQVEKTIAEKKEFAEQSTKGSNLVPPDVSTALADPKHIYPVSKTIGVTRAENGNFAGNLTAGDLLKLESGQDIGKDAGENTLVTMRVMTSKGEDDSVPAGTLVMVPLKELQEFDNEFRAKLDLGLAEADKNKDLFKQGAVTQ